MALLPSYFVLQSGGKYLSLMENIPASLPSGFLKFDEEPIDSPLVKFAAEAAKTGDGRYVHIRCCYNNKYLVMKQIETNSWIVASEKNPEEDESKESCTLFEPYSLEDDETTTVRLRHVQNRISTTHLLSRDGDTHQGVLVSSIGSAFNAFNWNAVSMLPKQAAFRSAEPGGKYLRSDVQNNGLIYQKFESGLDVADPRVYNKLHHLINDGFSLIESDSIKSNWKYWMHKDNWIMAENLGGKEFEFEFVHIEDNVFALRNLGNRRFCGPVTQGRLIDCLSANYPTLTRQTWLRIEECVVQREISNIVYRLNDSRIYDEQIVEVDSAYGDNITSQVNELTLSFSKTETTSRFWNNSVSINFGVKTTLRVTIVPVILTGKVETSAEFNYTHEWGVTETITTTRSASYTIAIPPFTKMKVSMMCTRGTCDVPFSYTQRDLLPSGDWISSTKRDGLFSGINSYSFYFQPSVARADNQGRLYL